MTSRLLVLGVCLFLFSCEARVTGGATCIRSSECAAPQVCVDGTCGSECGVARDCGAGRRCVLTMGIGRCLIESLDQCDPEPCELSGLTCRSDRCYNSCDLCTPDTVCVDGICVLPSDGG